VIVRRVLVAAGLAAALVALRVARRPPGTATVEQARTIFALASEVGEAVPDVKLWSRREADGLVCALRRSLANPDAKWRDEALRCDGFAG